MSLEQLALATRKGLLFVEANRQPRIIREDFPGAHVAIAFFDSRHRNLFACIHDGHFGTKLHRWTSFIVEDAATAADENPWKELAAPTYPTGAKIANGNDAVLMYPWSMATGGTSQPNRIYFGSEPGGLFVSDDNGETFHLVQGLWDHPSRTDEKLPWMGGGLDNPAIHSIVVDPRDENHVRVGISVAGVFESKDGGQSWKPKNKGLKADFLPDPDVEVGHDPHMLVQCKDQPDTFWQQNHCGVFVSNDSCQNWQKVSDESVPAHFGFAIAVDPHDGNTAWVIPAESDMVRAAVDRRLCVSRTTDGGKSWTAFRDGLPQEDCYDFVFRHSLLQSDDSLVFGTANGKLYRSDDRGETWSCIFANLPPVYCIAEL